MLVYKVAIEPSASMGDCYLSFGESFDAVDDDQFLKELEDSCSDLICLGDLGVNANVPDWADDIRGCIQNEPDRVYAALYQDCEGDRVEYFGLNAA